MDYSILLCYVAVVVNVSCENDANRSSGIVIWRNKRDARTKAFNRACMLHNCSNTECQESYGWNLYGSDWGCCGNYEGCCTWASILCYAHDAVCKCCDAWYCGPDCKKEPECFHEQNRFNSQLQGFNERFTGLPPAEIGKNESDNEFDGNFTRALTALNQIEQVSEKSLNNEPKYHIDKVADVSTISERNGDSKSKKQIFDVLKTSSMKLKTNYNETGALSSAFPDEILLEDTSKNNGSYLLLNVSLNENSRDMSNDIYNRTFSDSPSVYNSVSSSLTISLAFVQDVISKDFKHEKSNGNKKYLKENFQGNFGNILKKKPEKQYIRSRHVKNKNSRSGIDSLSSKVSKKIHDNRRKENVQERAENRVQRIFKHKNVSSAETNPEQKPLSRHHANSYGNPQEGADVIRPVESLKGTEFPVDGDKDGSESVNTSDRNAYTTMANMHNSLKTPHETSILWNIYHQFLNVFGEDSMTSDNKSMEAGKEQLPEENEGSGDLE